MIVRVRGGTSDAVLSSHFVEIHHQSHPDLRRVGLAFLPSPHFQWSDDDVDGLGFGPADRLDPRFVARPVHGLASVADVAIATVGGRGRVSNDPPPSAA